jgi:hypothetical protein
MLLLQGVQHFKSVLVAWYLHNVAVLSGRNSIFSANLSTKFLSQVTESYYFFKGWYQLLVLFFFLSFCPSTLSTILEITMFFDRCCCVFLFMPSSQTLV